MRNLSITIISQVAFPFLIQLSSSTFCAANLFFFFFKDLEILLIFN